MTKREKPDRCIGNCGCFWLRVYDATDIFKTAWPRALYESGRWSICLRDPCFMHVRYQVGYVEKNLYVKYIHHNHIRVPSEDGYTTKDVSTADLIQSEICSRCGDIQSTKTFQGINPSVVPFKFVPCAHMNT